MSKPAQLNEFDEARRVVGMVDSVTNKGEYMEIFGITEQKLSEYREIINNRDKIEMNFSVCEADKH